MECESDDEFQALRDAMIYKKRFPFERDTCEMGKKGMREKINYGINKSYFGVSLGWEYNEGWLKVGWQEFAMLLRLSRRVNPLKI